MAESRKQMYRNIFVGYHDEHVIAIVKCLLILLLLDLLSNVGDALTKLFVHAS